MLKSALLFIVFIVTVLFIRLSLAREAAFWSTLIWLLLAALIYKIMDLILPGVYHKYLENPIALYPAGKPKLSLEKVESGQYAHALEVPLEIEVRRGGRVALVSECCETNIGKVEVSRNREWSEVLSGQRLFYRAVCRIYHSERCPVVKGTVKLVTKRGEKASVKFTAHAED